MNLPTLLLAAGTLLAGTLAHAEEAPAPKFEKDRQAILQMAGDFEVTFHFQETLPLHTGYAIKEKAYDEDANETVKVVEDSGRRIVLQHVLQVGPQVVKHWSQVWTYEDTEILEFKGHRTWAKRTLTKEEAAGSWTQRVTEVTDEPRYEGSGRWTHHDGSSEWTSSLSNRPLPRREYTKRDDYDLLLVTNRHTVTPQGWYHEQDNTKQVDRDGASYPLCREIGLNTYKRVSDHDFSAANAYWTKTESFWKELRTAWDETLATSPSVTLKDTSTNKDLYQVLNDLIARAGKGETVKPEEIRTTLKTLVATPAKTAGS